MTDFTVSNDIITQPDSFRKRAQTDGYLFFKGLIWAKHQLNVRKQILELFAEAGWLKAGTDLVEGIACPGVTRVEPEPGYMEVYDRILQLEDFHALARHPELLGVLGVLFNEPVLVHPRNIARMIFPHFNRTTWDQIHQGWKSKEHQYYWKSVQLDIAEWTPEYHESAGVKIQAGA